MNVPLFAKHWLDDETEQAHMEFEWSLQPFRTGWLLYRDLVVEYRHDWDDSFLRSIAKHRPDLIAGIEVLEDGSVFFTAKELPVVSRASFQASMSKANRRYGGTGFTYEQWLEKLAAYNFCCANCGAYGGVSIDHIDGHGNNTIDNVQPLCLKCNSSKSGPGKASRGPGRPRKPTSRSHMVRCDDSEWPAVQAAIKSCLAKLRAS